MLTIRLLISVNWGGFVWTLTMLYTIFLKVFTLLSWLYRNANDILFLIHKAPLGKLSTRFRCVFRGIFDHSSKSAFVTRTNVWRGLALSLCSHSSQRCSIELRPVKFIHTTICHPCLYGPGLTLVGWANTFGNIMYPSLCMKRYGVMNN